MSKIIFKKDTHQYFYDGQELISVTSVLQAEGYIDLSKIPAERLEASWKFGTAVHLACELWDLGTLNVEKLSAPLIPYLAAWKTFKADYNITFTREQIERIVYSLKWGFAGTIDRDVTIKRKLTILDIKTPAEAYPVTALQLEGYRIAYQEMFNVMPKQRWAIHLTDKGTYKVEPYDEVRDRSVFIGAVLGNKWKKEKL